MKRKVSLVALIATAFIVGCLSASVAYLSMRVEIDTLKMENRSLSDRVNAYQKKINQPIAIDMGENQLIMINKELIKGADQAMLDKHQGVRLLFRLQNQETKCVDEYKDLGENISFLVPTEFVNNTFQIQTGSDRGGWSFVEYLRQ